ncbi:MAG: HTH domain-containing protein [Candidatus Methylomirabilis oxyfera]|nr:HTH domain-containing protein [Candidatus Methylomirabilis oxyfera]
MTILEQHAYAILVRHQGRGQAIGAGELARAIGVTERVARQVVKTLIEQHSAPIASSPHPPAGYYLPETLEEIRDTLESLKGRALSILTRMARLRRVALPELLGQLQMEIERDDAA